MKYSIFYISDDGLLKHLKDKWDRYDMLFLEEYESQEAAYQAIQKAVEDKRIDGFYQIQFVVLPSVMVKP